MKAKITATAKYLPERTLTNSDLEKMVDTNDEWITARTGIKKRIGYTLQSAYRDSDDDRFFRECELTEFRYDSYRHSSA